MLTIERGILTPSILSADFSSLGNALHQIEEGGADWVHLDVMDGHFVPNLTIGPPVIQSLRPLTDLPFDAHLMISQPERMIDAFAQAGCERITIHVEACVHLDRILTQIEEAGAIPAVSLNPGTPVTAIEDVLHRVQMVLLMSVNPGFGGQKFIPHVLKKIRQLRNLCKKQGIEKLLIQVDGGINQDTLPAVMQAGVDVIVIGSAIFNQKDVTETTRHYKNLLQQLTHS